MLAAKMIGRKREREEEIGYSYSLFYERVKGREKEEGKKESSSYVHKKSRFRAR